MPLVGVLEAVIRGFAAGVDPWDRAKPGRGELGKIPHKSFGALTFSRGLEP